MTPVDLDAIEASLTELVRLARIGLAEEDRKPTQHEVEAYKLGWLHGKEDTSGPGSAALRAEITSREP